MYLRVRKNYTQCSVLYIVPYSGKYWRGKNIGGFGSLKKMPNLYPPNFCFAYQARVSSSITYCVKISLPHQAHPYSTMLPSLQQQLIHLVCGRLSTPPISTIPHIRTHTITITVRSIHTHIEPRHSHLYNTI